MLVPSLLLAATLASGSSAAVPAGAVHAVIFVDLIPSERAAGSALLQRYVRLARQDPAVRSVVLIEQTSIPNHYILEATFEDAPSYRRFSGASWVRTFRAALFPHLGSPWDERLGFETASASASSRSPGDTVIAHPPIGGGALR